ncbi:MAG: ATP synthase F0 subunit C [Deltaproteobacteria bacterium]|jgi:F-type H+-transporting ATPase subunit c|nr:ATP synthase F0 subunit C [Deltaproteobacteria bacterium]
MKKIMAIFYGTFALLISNSAIAQEFAGNAAKDSGDMFKFKAMVAIAAGLAIAIATLGGAFGQSKVATAAMEGIARNPESAGKIMTPMIIALALIESLVIYALVIAFLLQGKI